jgi:four helix bundle protein
MAKGDDIREKLMRFATEVMDLCEHLPKSTAGSHVAVQLLRSATAAAPNYAEARGAESRKDFLHKLRIVLKELNEAEVWLELIVRRKMVMGGEPEAALAECQSLCRIVGASVRTARENDA